MNERKSLLRKLIETIDEHRAEQRNLAPELRQQQRPSKLSRLAGWFLHNAGILLIVVLLIVTQSIWSEPLRSPSAISISTISYQGRLADTAGNPLTDLYNMEFRIYDMPTGGTPLWEEYWTGGNSVNVSDGHFNVMLGSVDNTLANAIAGHDELYLGITVGSDSEMSPRVPLGSVPFSFQAQEALTVSDGSITTNKIADGAVTDIWYLAPTSAVSIPANTDWTDIADTSLTFSLDARAKVFLTYSINVQPNGYPGGDVLATRLVVDGAPYGSSGSHYHPYSSGNSNVNLNGNLVLDLAPGEHTVTLQWKSYYNTTSWDNDPRWCDGYCGARTITALAFYK